MASWFFKHVASNGRSHRNSLTGEPDLGHSPYQTWIVRLLCGDLVLLFLGSWRFPCCVCVFFLRNFTFITRSLFPIQQKHANKQTSKQANKQASKQANKQTKQASKQTNKASKQTNKQSKQSKPKRAKASSKKQETNRKSQPIKSKKR